jgi:hypothetical protein
MKLTKGSVHTLLAESLNEPAGEPMPLRCAGCCDVRLYTTNEKVLFESILAFENENKRNEKLTPSPILTVTTFENAGLYASLKRALGCPSIGWVSSFTKPRDQNQATSDQLLSSCQPDSGVHLVWNNYLKVFYAIDSDSRLVHVIGDGCESRFDVAVIHAIREWAMLWICQGDGWVPIHSSAACRDGRGILFLGGKMAGKTSTLLALLENGGYEFVANDRVFLKQEGECAWQIVGFPYWFKVRPDTVRFFPKLSSIETFNRTEKQILSALGVNRRMVADLSAIFFVSFDESLEEPLVKRLSPEEAQAQLVGNLFDRELNFLRCMFAGQRTRMLSRKSDLQGLFDHIPAYSLAQNIERLSRTVGVIGRSIIKIKK